MTAYLSKDHGLNRITPGAWVLLLLSCLRPAAAQDLPAKGSDAALEVATWNIEWFGSPSQDPADDEQQLENVEAVIAASGIDLWAVQEIASEDQFQRLLQRLGDGYDGVLGTNTLSIVQQRIGFIFKTEVVRLRTAETILADFDRAFAYRPPLQLEAEVTLPDTTVTITFITVHMKAGSGTEDYDRRLEAARQLKHHLDATALSDAPVMILGDFNDELLHSISGSRPSPYALFAQDSAHYFFPSLALDRAEQSTFCGSGGATCATCSTGSTIDHILISDELVPAYHTDSAARYEELLSGIERYVCTTSDHLPVYASFRFDRQTAAAHGTPAGAPSLTVHPDPFREHTTVIYTLPQSGFIRVDVYDLLGRRITSLERGFRPAGEHRVLFKAAGLPPGPYLVRIEAGDLHRTEQVTRVR